MEKLIGMVKKELGEIEDKGINTNNLEMVSKLANIYKDLAKGKHYEEKEKEGGQEMSDYGRYREGGGYGATSYRDGYRDGYNDGGSGSGGGYGAYSDYGRRGVPGSGRGRYRNSRMQEHIEKMREGADEYEYGKERYMHGGDDSRVVEGLEKLMYAVCMLVESTMDFAETPAEKEIVRKHIQKISRI